MRDHLSLRRHNLRSPHESLGRRDDARMIRPLNQAPTPPTIPAGLASRDPVSGHRPPIPPGGLSDADRRRRARSAAPVSAMQRPSTQLSSFDRPGNFLPASKSSFERGQHGGHSHLASLAGRYSSESMDARDYHKHSSTTPVDAASSSGSRNDLMRSGSRGEASARSNSVAAAGSSSMVGQSRDLSKSGSGTGSANVTCDKCDGKHHTDQCPHYRKDRERHRDAWVNYGKKEPHQMGSAGGNFIMKTGRVVRQPADGSCLFHSMAHGIGEGGSAGSLRREIANFVERNPTLKIAGDELQDWIKWDTNSTVSAYARRMATGGWGGGIEMAACSRLKNVNVHVYESRRSDQGFKRISCFDCPEARKTIHVLYQGGVHYDAIDPNR